MGDMADWRRGLDDRDAERRRARNERWMAEKGFLPLGEDEVESAADRAEMTIYGNAERLLQESRHTICEVETVADRAERLAARHTRYDGSPRR